MDKVILLRIGELFLKGKNRAFFENCLISNIKNKLKDIPCDMHFGRNRYVVSNFAYEDEERIIRVLKTVFGLNSLSIGKKTSSNYESIQQLAISMSADLVGSFRVSVNRADKRFLHSSLELSQMIGGDILDSNKNLFVDLHEPEHTIYIDIREDKNTYIFNNKIQAAGGMPVGTAGRGLVLLSGGIDSPVAAYMMAKRGVCIEALNFHSYPYTSQQAKEKVVLLAKKLSDYCGAIKLHFVSFTKLQEAINQYCDNSYLITVLRRFMMRAAECIAQKRSCGCIINGESLGQVASQTLQSITVTNSVINALPVFRPLIGMDKSEIIDISKKIDTYSTSILPYEDCCTVFMPKSPITKPNLEQVIMQQSRIVNAEELFSQAIAEVETIIVQ